jgi:hypothetical protein
MSQPPKSDPPLFELDEFAKQELKDLGFDPKDADEISVVTALAIVKDQRKVGSDNSVSFLAQQRYMSHKFGQHDRRITKLERLAFALYIGAGVLVAAFEVYKTFFKGDH